MTILDKLKRLKHLEGKATKGPWEQCPTHPNDIYFAINDEESIFRVAEARSLEHQHDGDLIAESRNALPEIIEFCLEAVEVLKNEHEEEQETLKEKYKGAYYSSTPIFRLLKKWGIE